MVRAIDMLQQNDANFTDSLLFLGALVDYLIAIVTFE